MAKDTSVNVLVQLTNVLANASHHNDGHLGQMYGSYNLSGGIRNEESATRIEASEPGSRSLMEMIIVGSTLGLINMTTILGNLLVCVTVASNKRLQNTTNYFIFSLALCDLLLGLLVLPFSNLNTLMPESWPLGALFCNLYTATDVMLCTVSILNLFAISLDRYFAVTKPYVYCRWTTTKKVAIALAAIWIFSFVMAFVPIFLGWNTSDGQVQNVDNPTLCLFEGNAVYVLLVSIGTYFTPLVIMCTVYIKVFGVAKQQVQRIKKLTLTQQHVADGSLSGKDSLDLGDSRGPSPRPSPSHRGSASESKATVTLASVVLAFSICWVPYFVLFTARPFVAGGFDPTLDLFVLWLGYVNSMLNPFLYAFHSSEFRYGFMLVLCRRRAERYRIHHPEAYFL